MGYMKHITGNWCVRCNRKQSALLADFSWKHLQRFILPLMRRKQVAHRALYVTALSLEEVGAILEVPRSNSSKRRDVLRSGVYIEHTFMFWGTISLVKPGKFICCKLDLYQAGELRGNGQQRVTVAVVQELAHRPRDPDFLPTHTNCAGQGIVDEGTAKSGNVSCRLKQEQSTLLRYTARGPVRLWLCHGVQEGRDHNDQEIDCFGN